MNKFFCAEACRKAGEDIIGSGTNHSTYVLVEYSGNWSFDAFNSPNIPDNLKQLITEIKQAKLSVRFLLVNQHRPKNQDGSRVLIYDQNQSTFSEGYRKSEFVVERLDQVAEVVKCYLEDETSEFEVQPSSARDIVVCTHGSHDKCCAKYGTPFYMQGSAMISELGLQNVQIWKASHFGGHRFAPTMIDFPDGRYYGLLDSTSFKSILTRRGNVGCLNRVYRGWGILPTEIQALERELILLYGWQWYKYRVACRSIEHHSDGERLTVSLAFKKPNSYIYRCDAELVKDEYKTMTLQGSCDAQKQSVFVKYSVTDFHLTLESEPRVKFKSFSEKKAS